MVQEAGGHSSAGGESAARNRRGAVALAAWVFGYGSLLWRVDFPYLERRRAVVRGWARRFWQGSRDHRGRPGAPGRVVTLTPAAGEECVGLAYRVDASVLAHLDHREKDGYERVGVEIRTGAGAVDGITYIAAAGNPGYLGPAAPDVLAAQVLGSAGPSGSNEEYLRELAAALQRLRANDAHVQALLTRVQALAAANGGDASPSPSPSA